MTFLAALPALASAAASAYSAFTSSRGQKDKVQNFDIYSPKQKQLIDMLSQNALQPNQNAFSYLNSLFSDDESAFEDYENPFMTKFQEDIIPSILERFGAMGALSSSGLNQSLARAGQGLTENLAAQRANLRQNGLQGLANLTGTALTEREGRYLQKGAPANSAGRDENIQNIITQLSSLGSSNGSSLVNNNTLGGNTVGGNTAANLIRGNAVMR